jgi:phytoene desaturase
MPENHPQKIVVIGAGISGLTSAVRLRHLGYDVEIYEKNPRAGGRMGLIELAGCQFDLGPTILMMPQIYREVFEFCGRNPDDYFTMSKLDPIYQVYFGDGSEHAATSELTRLIAELERVSEKDAHGYLRYIGDVYERYLVARDSFITRGFRSAGDVLNPATIRAALKLKTFNNAYAMIAGYVEDEKLRELLSFQTLYIGISPYNGPSIYTIIPMIELIYGVWFIMGGMRQYVTALERLFGELGGTIHFEAPVERIVLEGRRRARRGCQRPPGGSGPGALDRRLPLCHAATPATRFPPGTLPAGQYREICVFLLLLHAIYCARQQGFPRPSCA